MITTALIVTFVSSFIAIVVFGHVLLFAAVWPDFWAKRRKQPQAADVTPNRVVTLPN